MLESLEFSTLLISIFAGVMLGIPTGPARFFVVDTCIKEGKIAALQVYGGFITTKFIYAFLALLALDLISKNKMLEAAIYLIASFLLIVWGVIIIVKSGKKSDEAIQLNMDSLFKKGFVVGISNPAIPFIYLSFLQIIKTYTETTSTFKYVVDILTFETASFLTTAVLALLLLTKKSKVLDHWAKVKFVMGLLIIGIGTYQVFQHVEFDNGIKLKSSDSLLEEQVDTQSTK